MTARVKSIMPYPGRRVFTFRAECPDHERTWYGDLLRNKKHAEVEADEHNRACGSSSTEGDQK